MMIRKKKLKLKGKKIKYFDINNNKFYTIEDKKDVLKFINN
jgi:predicted nucleic-acid-binding Zn-ribbon protein